MWSNHHEFANEWIAAWNSHELARVLSHYEDDVVLTSPRAKMILGKSDGKVSGKAALRDYFTTALARLPDLEFKLDRVFSGINSVVLEFHTKDGRHGTEYMDIGDSDM